MGAVGTVPIRGSGGACTCGRVASGGGGGGGALRRAALGVGRRARGRASGEELLPEVRDLLETQRLFERDTLIHSFGIR